MVLLLFALILVTVTAAVADQPSGLRYRDLKVYTTSRVPDKSQPEMIAVRTQFVNEGKTPLRITAELDARRVLGFDGAKFSRTVSAGRSANWHWSFTAPDGLKREVLTGSLAINGKAERDLYIAVQGPDPKDMSTRYVERITERGRVVATYAPRMQSSIDAEMASRAAQQPPPALTLASAGKTDYTIVLEAEPASKDEVIGDLQRIIRLKSDAELPVTAKAEGPAIILRRVQLGPGLHGAYRIRCEGANVIIESPTEEGLRNGVYGLLTDHLGCNWFQPDALGEEIAIPEDKTVRLPMLDEVRGSPWQSCSGASWGRAPLWDRRNRAIVNGGRMAFGHAWEGYINGTEYPHDDFPLYYARDRKGEIRYRGPGANFCSTNPEVIDIVVQKVNQHFRKNPQSIVASLDPNDYAPMCLCDDCLALDKQYGQTREDGHEVSDRLLHFSKEVHDRLDPEFKDRYLGILAYAYQMDLPKSARPHPYHAGLICDMVWVYDHSRPWNDPTSGLNRDFHKLLKGWGDILTQFGYYDYFGHWMFYGPWVMVHKMREDLPAFRELGGTFLVQEAQPMFATQGINHYILAQLVWDLDVDVDLARETFFRDYYGPAAGPMREFWMTGERYYALERPSSNRVPRVPMRPEFWTDLAECLSEARKAVADLPADQKRFADRVKFTWDGFLYTRMRFDYEMQSGHHARDLRQPVDHVAGLAFLRKHGDYFTKIQLQYAGEDGYWPMMLPVYFRLNVEAAIKSHEDAIAAESSSEVE